MICDFLYSGKYRIDHWSVPLYSTLLKRTPHSDYVDHTWKLKISKSYENLSQNSACGAELWQKQLHMNKVTLYKHTLHTFQWILPSLVFFVSIPIWFPFEMFRGS